MSVYSKSDNFKRDIFSGKVKRGSIVYLKHVSGNSNALRFHGFSIIPGKIRACGMSWDNGALESYSLDNVIIKDITTDKRTDNWEEN